jgi:putative FmdB family regulatory protein
MPTYEYACRSCGEHLEVVQSFRDDALTTCPNCQGELRKVFSAAGIIFKGSGWHIKDYAGKSGSASTPATATGKDGGADSSGADSSSKDSSSGEGTSGTRTSVETSSGDKGSSSKSGGGSSATAESA